jgi:acetyltransferase-like isoleucine patch superfamily enzyme
MSTSRIHAGVELPDDAVVGEFVVLGVLPSGAGEPGALRTTLGPGAIIRSHTVVYAGVTIGARFQAGHGALVREHTTLGDDVSLGSHSIVEHHVRLGNRVRVHSGAFIPEFSTVEDDAWIGPFVVFTNARYPKSKNAKRELVGPRIGRGARIGAGAILLPGVVVGAYSLVGAGALVTCDVPEGKVVVGNPARVRKDVAELSAYRDEVMP